MNTISLLFIILSCNAVTIFSISITDEVYFTLYTNDNQKEGISLKIGDQLGENIKRDIPWKFFVHGWLTSPWVSPWFNQSKDNYFKKGEYNIVYVDWSKPAKKSYIESVLNAKKSGGYFGDFVLYLNKNNVPLSKIHFQGHSLGSHMVAFAAKKVKEQTKEKIYRVTGTDPAGPLYNIPILMPSRERLDKSDANFVDVIHTDAGNYGMITAVGHVDFYPNGGKRLQPGCENDKDENCSHARSVDFYAESIATDKFIARQAASYQDYLDHKFTNDIEAVFGEDIDTSLRGVFYFKTNSSPPYAQGKYKL